VTATGKRTERFEDGERIFNSVESKSRVVFSLGESRSSWVYRGMISWSLKMTCELRLLRTTSVS
jgi:hypothetical protein